MGQTTCDYCGCIKNSDVMLVSSNIQADMTDAVVHQGPAKRQDRGELLQGIFTLPALNPSS